MLRPMPYPEVYPPEEEDYHPVATAHTMFVDTIGRPEAETILEHLATSTAMMGVAQLRTLGGAMARVPVEATAFAHRQSRIMVNFAAVYERPEEIEVHGPWVEGFASALKQDDDGAYVNFLGVRRRGADPRRLPRERRGTAAEDQGAIRPDEPVPSQPEHPAGHGGRGMRFKAKVARPPGSTTQEGTT